MVSPSFNQHEVGVEWYKLMTAGLCGALTMSTLNLLRWALKQHLREHLTL